MVRSSATSTALAGGGGNTGRVAETILIGSRGSRAKKDQKAREKVRPRFSRLLKLFPLVIVSKTCHPTRKKYHLRAGEKNHHSRKNKKKKKKKTTKRKKKEKPKPTASTTRKKQEKIENSPKGSEEIVDKKTTILVELLKKGEGKEEGNDAIYFATPRKGRL